MTAALHGIPYLLDYQYVSEWPAGVYPGEIDLDARAASMAAHPAGKFRSPMVEIDPFEEKVAEVMYSLADLLTSKQADYGPAAINDSPGGPLVGINVRMHDKLSRAQHLRRKLDEGGVVGYESLVDTYRDLANYAVIAVMVLEGTWPQ